jgi:hypothetical protein
MDAPNSSKIVAQILQRVPIRMRFGGNARARVNPPVAIRRQIVANHAATVDANASQVSCAIRTVFVSIPINAQLQTTATLTMIAPAVRQYAKMDSADKVERRSAENVGVKVWGLGRLIMFSWQFHIIW